MRALPPLATLVAALAFVPAAATQSPDTPEVRRTSRVFIALGANYGRPVGEFDRYIDRGFGGGTYFLYRLDRLGGRLAIRVDAGGVTYGNERHRVCLRVSADCRRELVETSHDVATFGVGPQFMLPDGRLRPYIAATVGLAYFVSRSTVRSSDLFGRTPFAQTINFDHAALGYTGIAGLYIPVRRKRYPISVDVAIRYHRNGRAAYLREGSIVYDENGFVRFTPIRSEANLLVYQLGMSFGLGW